MSMIVTKPDADFQTRQRTVQVKTDLRDPQPAVARAVRPVPLRGSNPRARDHGLGQGPENQR